MLIPFYQKQKKTIDDPVLHSIEGIILKCYPKTAWFWMAMIKIFWLTGMRRRQLVHLQWNDIDLKKSYFVVS